MTWPTSKDKTRIRDWLSISEEARKDLRVLAQRLGYDLYGDGLKIYITINSRMQQYAEEAMDSAMRKLQHRFDILLTAENRNLWIDSKGRPIDDAFKNYTNELRLTETW